MIGTITTLLLVAAIPTETNGVPFHDLGEQYVNSLRNEDIVEYAQCWMSFRRLRAIAANKPIPREAKKVLGAMKAYYEARNQHVAHSFKVLTELFKTRGDIAGLQLVSIEGKVSEEAGMRMVSMFRLRVALDSVEYEIRIDDGFEDRGAWFFSDKPLDIRNLATEQWISLEKRNG